MPHEAATGSIAHLVAQILTAFEAIDAVEIQAENEQTGVACVGELKDQVSKFKLWAGNIGAHRTGRSSLDYRLRDSSHLYSQVGKLLDNLLASLSEAHSILSGEKLPWDKDPGDTDELDEELKDLLANEEFEFDSELSQLTNEIADTISNLLRLSISLRNPAPHDRFMSSEYAKARYFEASDMAHVEAKFPKASQSVIARLGQAISQRRQYFKYREAHHEKLAHGLYDSGRSEFGAQSTIASSVPLAMKGVEAQLSLGEVDEDERSNSGYSQTSFATTAPESERLHIPPLPKKACDGPFECPFCFMIISVSSKYQWKKHVLRDLRPYTCLMENCLAVGEEYSSHHEWMNHMRQKHWTSWICPYQCDFYGTTESSLREHIIEIHSPATLMELDAMIIRCGQTRSLSSSEPVGCPLCQDTLDSFKQYQRHVGRHQVDLALFALPRIYEDDEELSEQDQNQEMLSTSSGSDSVVHSEDIPDTMLAMEAESQGVTQTSTLTHSAASMNPIDRNLKQNEEEEEEAYYGESDEAVRGGRKVVNSKRPRSLSARTHIDVSRERPRTRLQRSPSSNERRRQQGLAIARQNEAIVSRIPVPHRPRHIPDNSLRQSRTTTSGSAVVIKSRGPQYEASQSSEDDIRSKSKRQGAQRRRVPNNTPRPSSPTMADSPVVIDGPVTLEHSREHQTEARQALVDEEKSEREIEAQRRRLRDRFEFKPYKYT